MKPIYKYAIAAVAVAVILIFGTPIFKGDNFGSSFGTQNFFYAPGNVITPLAGFTTSWAGTSFSTTSVAYYLATTSPLLLNSVITLGTGSQLWAVGASSTDSNAFDFTNQSTGIAALHIGTSGFVGINTLNPTAELTLDAGLVGTSSPLLEIGTTTASRYMGISGDRLMIGEDSYAFGLAGAPLLLTGTNKGFELGVNGVTGNFGPYNKPLSISIDPQNNMTITSTTTISGTTTISNLLSVSNLATFAGGFISSGTSTVGDGTQAGGLAIFGGATTTKSVIINGNGNQLVIGNIVASTTPYLYVSGSQAGDVSSIFQNTSNSGTTGVMLGMQTNSSAGGNFTSGAYFRALRTNLPTSGSAELQEWNSLGAVLSENMVIKPGGNAGFGTTTPVANFQATNATANSTTTVELGQSGQNKGTCLKLYRGDGSAIYAWVNTGATTLTLSTSDGCATGITGF